MYKTITFARSRHPVGFSYIQDGTVLDRVSSINNIGVIMDEKITFLEHVDVMVAKTFAMLEFISEVSHLISGSCKTGIRKLRVEPVL
jgi:hypothetical protein